MIRKSIICDAVNNKQIIRFNYEGRIRIVEPHLVGQKSNNDIQLSAYQVGGTSESRKRPPWRYYDLSGMTRLTLTGDTFDHPRPGYNRNDKNMTHIYCRI